MYAHHAGVVAAGVEAPEPKDEFYGVRVYTVEDSDGNTWTF